jgi:hypothetical protein
MIHFEHTSCAAESLVSGIMRHLQAEERTGQIRPQTMGGWVRLSAAGIDETRNLLRGLCKGCDHAVFAFRLVFRHSQNAYSTLSAQWEQVRVKSL